MTDLADLPDDIDALKSIIVAMDDRNQRLEKLVEAFRHAIFGRKSEKTDPDQYELALEDIETGIAAIEAEKEACDVTPSASRKTPRNVNRGSLPKHLPRVEFTIEPDKTACACGAERHVIGEDVSERLDVIPAQFRVIRCPADDCAAIGERGHAAPTLCLPGLRKRDHPGTGPHTADPGRVADRGHSRPRSGLQIC